MTTPTREQVVHFATAAGASLYADTICFNGKDCDDFIVRLVTLARADLEATIAELRSKLDQGKTGREIERLKSQVEFLSYHRDKAEKEVRIYEGY